VQSPPRPPASVPLGGSLRASRAAQLARPHGPLAAVDLADGRALAVERLAGEWVASEAIGDAPTLRGPAVPEAEAAASVPVRRRRLGAALLLAGALGAAVVALATGFSGSPAPAVAGPTARTLGVLSPVAQPLARAAARGGRASALPRPEVRPPAPPATRVTRASATAPVPAPPPPPAGPEPPAAAPVPPALPELPPAPAL